MDPAEAVRALYDAAVAGEDYSRHATGPLAESLRIEAAALREVETAARSFTVRRLETVRQESGHAVVAVDADYTQAYRRGGDDWKVHTQRVRGRAQVVEVDGRWLVADLPVRGGRWQRAAGQTAPVSAEGDLALEARVAAAPRQDDFSLLLRNEGEESITPVRLVLDFRVLRTLELRLRPAFTEKRTLATDETWAFVYSWKGPPKRGSGLIGIEAVDEAGRLHRATASFRSPRRPTLRVRLASALSATLLFEAAALALVVWGLLPGWIVTTFLPGIALACAAVFRAGYVLGYLAHHARGSWLVATGALAAAEFALGAWLVVRADPGRDALFILISVLALLTPTIAALRRRA